MTNDELYRHLFKIDETGRFCVSLPISFLCIISQWIPSAFRQSIADDAMAQYNDRLATLSHPMGGTFNITHRGNTTSAFAFDTTDSAIQTALEELASIADDATA